MTRSELKTYRTALIEQLTSHTPAAIDENAGGWATDRLDAIRDAEWDLAEMGEEFTPFNLARWRITGEV
jgi:hypothetical protein